jgi:hypothetical protein
MSKEELKFSSETEALQYLADLTGKKIKIANESKYGWIITWGDPEIDLDGDKGKMGPSNINEELEKKLKAGEGDKFELYDDDKTLYYKGLIIGDYQGFEPLDDFGKPNAGATGIKIKEKWL